MHLDSCRELKATLRRRLVDLGAPPAAEEPRSWVGLGISRPSPDMYELAVRVADLDVTGDVVGRLAEAAADEIDVQAVGRIRALSAPPPEELQQRQRPLVPGSSIAHPDVTAGTLGGFVTLGGALHALSNNHVLANAGEAQLGDPGLQPGPADGGTDPDDRIGTLAAMSQLSTDQPNVVDAALVAVDEQVQAETGAYPGGPLSSVIDGPPDDDAVEKLGRTTGHTHGRVTAFEVDGLRIDFPASELVFDNQIEVTGADGAFSDAGDSGSVIWTGSDRGALALLFAGSTSGGPDGSGLTYANPLTAVLSAFGPQWAGGANE